MRDAPTDRNHRARFASGLTQLATGNIAGAQASFAGALDLWRRLREEHPSLAAYQYGQSMTLKMLGRSYRADRDFERAFEDYRTDLDLMRGLRAHNPSSLIYNLQLGHQLRELEDAHREVGRNGEAIAASQEAAGLLEEYLETSPAAQDVSRALGGALRTLAASQWDSGQRDQAIHVQARQLEVLEATGGDSRFRALLVEERSAAAVVLAGWLLEAGEGSSDGVALAVEALQKTVAGLREGAQEGAEKLAMLLDEVRRRYPVS